MRGKASCLYFRVPLIGITPAYAGKSLFNIYDIIADRDHPRVCGEKVEYVVCTGIVQGSPPRMRGKDQWATGKEDETGITPAYAGKSIIPTPNG